MTEEIEILLARVLKLATLEKKTELIENKSETVEKVGIPMPRWPEEVAAIPTEFTRVSLFGLPADCRGERQILDGVKLASRADLEVIYTGKELCAKDETAWLSCLRLGRGIPMGERIYLTKAALLRDVGLTNTGPNWKTLEGRLDRLSIAHTKVRLKRNDSWLVVNCGLMKFGFDEDTDVMYFRLDPEGARLFDNLAYQPWEIRLALKKDISARLLSYVTGHLQGKPHSVLLEDLLKWCGYPGRLRQFRTACLEAFKELERKDVLVSGSSKIIKGAKGDVACWVRENMMV